MALSSNWNSDWASLAVEVLDLILDYLVPMEDYFSFSEVCLQWRHAVCGKLQDLRSNHKRYCRLHQQAPFLLAPTTDGKKPCLYDVVQGKSNCEFELRLGQESCRIEGSSHGWLILLHLDSSKVILYNPFSGEIIHLPPLEEAVFTLISESGLRSPVIPGKRRCVLSMDPDDVINRDEVVLMVTCNAIEHQIAFIKLGEKHWTYVKELQDVKDIACIDSGSCLDVMPQSHARPCKDMTPRPFFYVVDNRGKIFYADVKNSTDDEFYKLRWIPSPSDLYKSVQYLVESPEGDLLRVVKNKGKFFIYKLVWFSRDPRWEEVMDLGDVAIFLGENHSISVTASDFPGCEANSIYFCECNTLFYSSYFCECNTLFCPDEVYVFSLANRTSKRLPSHPREPLLWISSKFV